MSQNQIEKQIERVVYFVESNPDPRKMKRALAVKLARQGYIYSAIENILNASPAFVSKGKQNFQEKGIEGLRLAYKGAKKTEWLPRRRNNEMVVFTRVLKYRRIRNLFN